MKKPVQLCSSKAAGEQPFPGVFFFSSLNRRCQTTFTDPQLQTKDVTGVSYLPPDDGPNHGVS